MDSFGWEPDQNRARAVIGDIAMGTKGVVGRLPSMPGMPRASKAGRTCECGCGGETKGGRFIPGHDARRLGWAIRIHRGFDVTGITAGELKAAKKFIADSPDKFIGPSSKASKVTVKGKRKAKPEAPAAAEATA
jgi:hypothetical protein